MGNAPAATNRHLQVHPRRQYSLELCSVNIAPLTNQMFLHPPACSSAHAHAVASAPAASPGWATRRATAMT